MKTELALDVCYGTHERNFFDIAFPSEAKGNVDLVLMIHGGGWIGGDKDVYRADIQKFAESGVVSASMNYRYVSENSHCSNILDDITAALKKIKEVGAEKGINIEKALLTGLSAGGHLSLLYSYSRRDEAPILPVAVVSLSGPTDMSGDEAVQKYLYGNDMGDCYFIADLFSKVSGHRIDVDDLSNEAAAAANRKISPIYYVDGNTVPTVICHALKDTIVPFCNAVALEKALTENGVPHEFIVFPKSGHVLEKDPDCTEKKDELTRIYIEKYLSVFKA